MPMSETEFIDASMQVAETLARLEDETRDL
jgi:hypothetical protein